MKPNGTRASPALTPARTVHDHAMPSPSTMSSMASGSSAPATLRDMLMAASADAE
jgi:hypothetical protein